MMVQHNRTTGYIRSEGTTGKAVRHKKLTPQEFSELVVKAELTDEDVAFLVGTRPDRVAAWRTGVEDVPFYLCWAMELLETPANLNLAMEITSQRAPFKPEFVGRARIHEATAAVVASIEAAMPEAIRVADIFERDNAGTEHPSREILRRFAEVQQSAGTMNPAKRLAALTDIAGAMGIGTDINRDIERDNAPFIAEVARKRRIQTAKERAAKPDLPAYRK